MTVASGTYLLSSAYNSERKVVADPAGNLYVAYTLETKNDSYYVEVAKSSDSGATWTDLPKTPSVANSSRSAITVDRQGRIDLVWTEGAPQSSQIFFSSFYGGSWSDKVLLSNSKWYSGFPSMVVDSLGHVHVVWYGFDGTNYRIYYVEWNGSAWGVPFALSNQLVDSLNPTIAVDAHDGLHVAWYGLAGKYYQVWYTEFDGSWKTPTTVTDFPTDSSNPSMAIGPSGQIDLVWAKNDNGTLQVYHMSGVNGNWGQKQRLTNGSKFSESPTQAFSANGSLYVFWEEGGAIYGCILSTRCAPGQVFAEGYNTFPSAAPLGSHGIGLLWTHQVSAANTEDNSILFTTINPEQPASGLAEAILIIVAAFVIVLSARLLSRKRK